MPSTTIDVPCRRCLRLQVEFGSTLREPLARHHLGRTEVEFGTADVTLVITGPTDVLAEALRGAHEAVGGPGLSPVHDQSRIEAAKAWLHLMTVTGGGDGSSDLQLGRALHHLANVINIVEAAQRR